MSVYAAGPFHKTAPTSLVVFLHGLGANGQDLISLGEEWAPALPFTLFVSPDAPFACDMAPFGYQWFSLQDRRPEVLSAGVETAATWVFTFLDAQAKQHNIPASRVVLVGFSQGAALALHVGLHQRSGCAGVISYSGLLIAPEKLKQDILCRPPVLVIHGSQDTIVPASVFEQMVKNLNAVGLTVDSHLIPNLGHSINAAGLDLGQAFLKRVLEV